MTLNLAWVAYGNVYVVSDAAVTYGNPDAPVPDVSTFGEHKHVEDDSVTQEGALKILRVGPETFVTGAGDGDTIVKFGNLLRDDRSKRIDASVDEALSILRESGAPGAQFLIADRSTGEARLLQARTRAGAPVVRVPEGKIVFQGSLPEAYKELAVAFLRVVLPPGVERPPHEVLQAMVVRLQAMGAHHALLQEGVGGAFYGVRIGADGSHWMGDIYYNFYAHEPATTGMMARGSATVLVRDDVVMLGSTQRAGHFVCLNAMSNDAFAAFESKWKDRVQAPITEFDVPYLAFIDLEHERAVLLDRRRAIEVGAIQLIRDDKPFPGLGLIQEIHKHLMRPADNTHVSIATDLLPP